MRILGIDIGSHSVKAVELDSAFGRYEVHEYHEHPIEAGQDPRLVVSSLLSALSKKPDRIAYALRTGQSTFRNLQLPTRDKKSIASGVGFELEDELPFSLSHAVYDYTTLAQSRLGVYLHVAATMDRVLQAEIEKLQVYELDPDLITTEAWAIRTYLNRSPNSTNRDQVTLLIHMGQQRTVIYAHLNGTPLLCREINWGGGDLTYAIAQHYSIPLHEAEKGKLDHGFVVSPSLNTQVTREQIDFSAVVSAPLAELIVEVKQAKLSCKNVSQMGVGEIVLSGGTSTLPGLVRFVQDAMGVPTRKIQALSSLNVSGVTYSEQADSKFLIAVSLALTVVERATSINLRKGRFGKKSRSGPKFNATTLKKPLWAAGAIGACFMASLVSQTYLYHSQMEDTDAQLERSVKTFFGQVSPSVLRTYLHNPNMLKKAVDKELSRQKELAKLLVPNPKSPLEFIKELSSTVPKDLSVDLIQYQAGAAPGSSYLKGDDASASLTFLVNDSVAADKLNKTLATHFPTLEKGKVEDFTPTDGSPKRLKLIYSGKLNEDAYGK